jgi:hypothetical protein
VNHKALLKLIDAINKDNAKSVVVEARGHRAVITLMRNKPYNMIIQALCCLTLMRNKPYNMIIQALCCLIVHATAKAVVRCIRDIIDDGGIPLLLGAIDNNFIDNDFVCEQGLMALFVLVVFHKNAIMQYEQAVPTVLRAMQGHKNSTSSGQLHLPAGCVALFQSDGWSASAIVAAGGIQVLEKAKEQFANSTEVQKWADAALACLEEIRHCHKCNKTNGQLLKFGRCGVDVFGIVVRSARNRITRHIRCCARA